MHTIASLTHRRILNSHAAFTTEFTLRLDDGTIGLGASPEGETISIFEDKTARDPEVVIATVRRDGLIGRPIDQEGFDEYLAGHIEAFGRNTCYALSLAFYEAIEGAAAASAVESRGEAYHAPTLCCNVLNGGQHAYTNPVLSDFPEYLLVARSDDLNAVIACHDEIQRAVRDALVKLPETLVGGNPVRRFATADNRECIEFLLGVRTRLGLANDFDLMIDASAGDLWAGDAYALTVTDGSRRSSDELCAYWIDLLEQYPVRFLEDPFRENDSPSWSSLAGSQSTAC